MSQPAFHRLGDLQLRILKALWTRGEASVAQVHEAIPDGAHLAYTTVATMLRKLEGRGLVKHRTVGRTFIYSAVVPEAQVSRSMAEHMLDRLFGGSVTGLVNHLLTAREISPRELTELGRLIARRRKSS